MELENVFVGEERWTCTQPAGDADSSLTGVIIGPAAAGLYAQEYPSGSCRHASEGAAASLLVADAYALGQEGCDRRSTVAAVYVLWGGAALRSDDYDDGRTFLTVGVAGNGAVFWGSPRSGCFAGAGIRDVGSTSAEAPAAACSVAPLLILP